MSEKEKYICDICGISCSCCQIATMINSGSRLGLFFGGDIYVCSGCKIDELEKELKK